MKEFGLQLLRCVEWIGFSILLLLALLYIGLAMMAAMIVMIIFAPIWIAVLAIMLSEE